MCWRARSSVVLAALMLAVPAWADVSPPKVYTTTPGGINVSDGALVHSATDLSMGPLSLERYHRSGLRQPNEGMFGRNFSSNFDIYVAKSPVLHNNSVIVHIGNSASGMYLQTGTSAHRLYDMNYDAGKGILTWTGSQYVYTDSSGTIYTFSATHGAAGTAGVTQRVERIDFPDGRRQTFTYTNIAGTSTSRLKLVEDSSGYALVFDLNSYGDVIAACMFKRSETYVTASTTCTGAPLYTTYGYASVSSYQLLTSATDVLGGATNYTNVVRGVTCIMPPSMTTCALSQGPGPDNYDINFSTTQTLADGGTWQVGGWDPSAVVKGDDASPPPSVGHLEVSVTDPDNQVLALTFTKSSPATMVDVFGRITRYKFWGGSLNSDPWGVTEHGSMLREVTYPEGDKYQADYNGPFMAISSERHVPKGGGTPLEKLYQYGSCTVSPGTYQNCAKPIAIRDPAENWTNYSYWAHGGIRTEMAPAPDISQPRPLKVTTWVQRYAWTKNSGGALVQNTAFPVWLKNTETQCQTLSGPNPAATCDPAAPQTVTTYEYGADGTGQSLLVRGVVVTADGTSLRTCYGYDLLDRKIYETRPNAELSSCL